MNMKPYIVYADDDSDDQEIFKDLVHTIEGPISTVIFNEGASLLQFLDSIETNDKLPNVVVLDINMPGANGFFTLERIRSNTRFRELPVVIYTTSSDAADKNKSFQLGATEFIPKPIFKNEFDSFKSRLLKYIHD
ncbi:MAG: response regulator [Niastella sp.]|nr:response regulator [Niastella sp.]